MLGTVGKLGPVMTLAVVRYAFAALPFATFFFAPGARPLGATSVLPSLIRTLLILPLQTNGRS